MVAVFDEMTGANGNVRPAYSELSRWLHEVPADVLDYRRREAELLFRRIGITFAVYGKADAQERLIAFDVIPRIMSGAERQLLERGLTQPVKALNLFIKDVYGARVIPRAGVVPDDLVFRDPAFRPEMSGQSVPYDIYIHIAGIDIVRVDAETFYVLEDNARTPSGVSYMLENREIMMRLFPKLFARLRIAPVESYPDELLATRKSVAPVPVGRDPTVVLLTPGIFNPTAEERGFKNLDCGAWISFSFPKGTPQAIVQRLAKATNDAVETPAVRERFMNIGVVVPPPERRTPEYLTKYVVSETARRPDQGERRQR